MDKVRPYFSFQGRTNRQRCWLTTLAILAIYVVGMMVGVAFMAIPLLGGILMLAVVAVITWVGLALAARRLHDRNKSAWWLLLMYLPIVLVSALAQIVPTSDPDAGAVFSALSLPFSIWILVELGCLKGTTGPNRFGDDPLHPAPVELFS